MKKETIAALEALLFTAEKPVPLGELAAVIELDRKETRRYLGVIKEEYQKESHGFLLKEYDNSYKFVSCPRFAGQIKELHNLSREFRLSKAALETLAIIAYRQPVTRSEIEEIRGVKAEKTLLTLSKYDLIKELGRKETIGNPIVYGTTEKFLVHFDLSSLSELPDINNHEE